MSIFKNILMNLPEVSGPEKKKLAFKEKLKWSLVILTAFFVLGMIPLFGLDEGFVNNFKYLQIILAANFGSIVSLGIGPIVTGSIVLQLLNGSGLWKFDLTSQEGKRTYQGTQKLMSIFFVVFEAAIYVFMGGLSPAAGHAMFFQLQLLLIGQLILGGLIIMLMDEVITKWGFGSGISLFIAAGVSKEIVWKAFSPFTNSGKWFFTTADEFAVGKVWSFFEAVVQSNPTTAIKSLLFIGTTAAIFAIATYMQAMKVEIPLSFGRVRGHGMRWPLNFLYTSVIPVILVAALFANFQLAAQFLGERAPFLGTMVSFLQAPGGNQGLVGMFIESGVTVMDIVHAFSYMLFMIVGCVVFSFFWIQTSGMDAKSQAKQMMNSGLQIPGFRKDQRVLENLLKRYIGPLTIMGGISIGILASLADVIGALSRGTGILLAVMIVYKLYEEIAKDHMMDMHPSLRKIME